MGAQVAAAKTDPKVAGKGIDELKAHAEKLADQVALSTKGKATAAAAANASGGAPAPTVASLFQAQNEKSANGPMASAFVAGPDQPWGSRWVFGAADMPSPEEIAASRASGGKPTPLTKGEISLDQLKKLVEATKAKGGDESQLKQAAESTLHDIDSAIAALGGELEGVRADRPGETPVDANGNPVQAKANVFGGAEYLSALQGASRPEATGKSLNGGLGGRSNGRNPQALAGVPNVSAMETLAVPSAPADRSALGAKPNLEVLPGGLAAGGKSEGGRLEGGLRLAKDEPKLQTDTFYPNGMPLTAAVRPGESNGAMMPQTITGHVVPGSMMRDRLTSESLRNVSNGIANMSGAGGGEMRIKLNPGNLGELMIRVSTDGKDVGLKVQANDPAAKKIIEESLSSLRDSLASQSLSLGRVDVTLAPAAANASDLGQGSQHSHGQHAFSGFDQSANQQRAAFDGYSGNEGRSSRSADSGDDRSVSRGASARIAAMGSAGGSARAASSSRLDVMA